MEPGLPAQKSRLLGLGLKTLVVKTGRNHSCAGPEQNFVPKTRLQGQHESRYYNYGPDEHWTEK